MALVNHFLFYNNSPQLSPFPLSGDSSPLPTNLFHPLESDFLEQITDSIPPDIEFLEAILVPSPSTTFPDKTTTWNKEHTHILLSLASDPAFRKSCLTENSINQFCETFLARYGIDYAYDTLHAQVKRLSDEYPKAFVNPEKAFPQEIQNKIKDISLNATSNTPWSTETRYYAWILGHFQKNKRRNCEEIATILNGKFQKTFKRKQISSQLQLIGKRLKILPPKKSIENQF